MGKQRVADWFLQRALDDAGSPLPLYDDLARDLHDERERNRHLRAALEALYQHADPSVHAPGLLVRIEQLLGLAPVPDRALSAVQQALLNDAKRCTCSLLGGGADINCPIHGATEDDMCPNCVTPDKCNGPHIPWVERPGNKPQKKG